MDHLQIGSLSFERNASKSDMRLDFCSTLQEAALDCGDLAFDTMEAEVFTKTVGAQLAALSANTPIIVYRGNEVYARFVKLTVSRIAPNSYRITGRSPMGSLTAMAHAGGIYTGQTANDIITDICGDIPVLVESVYSNMKLYGWLPYADGKEKSARDNLTQVLFAIGAYLRTDLNGVLRIEKAWDGTASTIPADRSYSGGTVDYASPISSVSVTEHQYAANSDGKELFSGTTQTGDIVTFSEPMHSLTTEGFTILESNANYAKLSSGTGTLKGKTYTHNTRLVTRTVTEGAAENVISVTDATLVSIVNSVAVANRLAEYYKHRETISNGVVAGSEKPGHVVSIYHPYDKKMVSACVESLDTTMSATIKSSMTARVDFIPPQPETAEYYDDRVLLTGSGEWEVPDGITSYTMILIGGGDGGWSGLRGEDAPILEPKSYTTASGERSGLYIPCSEGGAGGEAGQSGLGGKVLVKTVTNVTAGAKIAYSCGKGGIGGIYSAEGSVQGASGTPTTMGDETSDSGSSTDAGYTDVSTGQQFAKIGQDGIAGSKGHGKKEVGTTYEDSPSPSIVVDGVTYSPGQDNEKYGEGYDGDFSVGPYGACGWEWYGGFGGGAAYGANGQDGRSEGVGSARVSSSSGRASATAPAGGDGADAVAPAKATQYGQGGRGGHGGGGAGSYSEARAWQALQKSLTSTKKATLSVSAAVSRGGKGSDGGEGADGCIILFLHKTAKIDTGPLVSSDNLWLLDKLGRWLIV